MAKITQQQLNRQTNYVIVNSKSQKAYADTIEILSLVTSENKDMKGFFLADEQTDLKKIPYNNTIPFKRGASYKVDFGDKSVTAGFEDFIFGIKYCVMATDPLNSENYKQMLSDAFRKKSIDVIKHQEGLLISEYEKELLKRSVNELTEGKPLSRNFAYRIYPDPDFSFDKETFIKLKKQHETIDVFGLMLTQYVVNNETNEILKDIYNATQGDDDLTVSEIKSFTEKYIYYHYFTRKIAGASEHIVKAGISYLSENLGFNEAQKSIFLKVFLGIESEKKEDKQPDVTQNPLPNDDKDKKVFLAVKQAADKIFSGEVNIITQEDSEKFLLSEYAAAQLEAYLSIQEFDAAMKKEIQSRLKKMNG